MSIDRNDSEQFERYLKGEMSGEEANAFEKEVLKDPFSQEALEGMEGHDSDLVFEDLEKMKSKVARSRNSGFSFMKVAAVVSLLVVSSIAVWLVISPLDKEETLAMESKPIEQEEKIATEKEEVQNEVVESEVAKADMEPTENSDAVTSTEEEDNFFDEEVRSENQVAVLEEPTITEEPVDEVILEEAVAEDVVVEEVELDATSAFAAENAGAGFGEEDDLEVQEAVPAVAPLALQEAEISSKSIAADDAPEIEVEEKAKRAEPAARFARARSASAGKADIDITESLDAQPETGMDEYEKYLEENINYPDAAKENQIKGTVVLDLVISTEGVIEDITVRKSLGYGCDIEAIRLINEGPKWVPAQRNGVNVADTVKVRVRFNLR